MEWATLQTKLNPDECQGKEMKGVAEEEPVVRVVEVADPVQVRLALGVVPPHRAGLLVALKGLYEISSMPLPLVRLRRTRGCIVFGIVMP